MRKEISIDEKKIEYSLRRNRKAKNLRLTVYCDGSLALTVPWRVSFKRAQDFILQNSDWVTKKIEGMKNRKSFFSQSSQSEYSREKKMALQKIKQKVEHFNKFYGFSYNRITVRNQKTRWGSCSSKRNLNYNYRVAMLPDKYADYIIVHELCHLGQFDHSEKFWNLVKKTVPDCDKIKKRLKKV